MVLGLIERGAKLSVAEEIEHRPTGEEYEAAFNYLENDYLFIVQCGRLFERFDTLAKDVQLNFSLRIGAYIHTFTGRAVEKKRGGMVLVEQLSEIQTFNRRQFDRDEIRVPINVFSVPKNETADTGVAPDYEQVISDTTFDISAGGFCIITNKHLDTKHDPDYLAKFALSEKEAFQLPAEIMRRSIYQRTSIGRYDFGFRFIFDTMPEERDRLLRGIVNRKLTTLKR